MPARRSRLGHAHRFRLGHALALGRRSRTDRGEVNLQYTIAFPVLLLVIGMITQAAWWYSARNAALAAAQEGVRAARVRDGSPGAGRDTAQRFARQTASGQLRSPSVSVAADGRNVTVRVTGEVWSFVPGLNLRVSQEARAPRERFTTPEDP